MNPELPSALAFRQEAIELLSALEDSILLFDCDNPDPELINRAFRAIHSLKGSGSMFGLPDLVGFCHLAESLFELFRDGTLQLSPELIELSLQSSDHLWNLLPGSDASESVLARGQRLESVISALLPAGSRQSFPAGPAAAPELPAAAAGPWASWHIRFQPASDLFRRGINMLQLIEDLAALGQLVTIGQTDRLPDLDGLEPEDCCLCWEFLLHTQAGALAIRDVFIFVENGSRLDIHGLDTGVPVPGGMDLAGLGRVIAASGGEAPAWLSRAREQQAASQPPVREKARAPEAVPALAPDSAPACCAAGQAVPPAGAIQVDPARLDTLSGLAGELVNLQSRYRQLALGRTELARDGLDSLNDELEQLARDLRGLATDLHMVPLSGVFAACRDMADELAGPTGLAFRLETSGNGVTLESGLVPHLVRLLRGLLSAAAARPGADNTQPPPTEPPVFRLDAWRQGDAVLVSLQLPGGWLDAAALLRQAGAIPESGLKLEARSGAAPAIVIRIPLRLAVAEVLLVRIGGERFALNLPDIVACRSMASLDTLAERGLVVLEGEAVPLIDLAAEFCPGRAGSSGGIAVFLSQGESPVAVLVDAIDESLQSVIKPLGPIFGAARGLNGAIILGDGSLALLVDTNHFLARSQGEMTPKTL
jgi:two-component system chemotaxis sensor kinase CheA